MKTLMQMRETSKEDLPDIYCDLDQVLVAFIKGAEKAIGGDFATSDKDERWKAINQTKGFWANLDWMPGAKRLYQFIEKYDPYVLSAFSGRDPSSKNGKMKWLAKNTNWKKSRINLVMRSHKQRYATTDGKPNVLIDDYIKNIREWEKKGGIGVHHTDVAKTINDLKRLGFKEYKYKETYSIRIGELKCPFGVEETLDLLLLRLAEQMVQEHTPVIKSSLMATVPVLPPMQNII